MVFFSDIKKSNSSYQKNKLFFYMEFDFFISDNQFFDINNSEVFFISENDFLISNILFLDIRKMIF